MFRELSYMPFREPEDRRASSRAYYATHKEERRTYNAAYRAAHREELRLKGATYGRAYYATHKEEKRAYAAARKEEKRAYNAAYRVTRREKICEKKRAYHAAHQEEKRAYDVAHRKERQVYVKFRRETDPLFRLKEYLRTRLANALAGRIKSGSTCKLLGCTISEWRSYLEKQFRLGMTWENYGPVWHVDHVRPCASFDLSDPVQQRACFHWSNTQPLFAEENLKKGAKFTPPGP